MGYKLESFIFDAIQYAKKPIAYECERLDEFAPLKNAPGVPCDSPEYCRKMVLELHARWLVAAGAEILEEVEIPPMVSYAGEGLERYKNQAVRGLVDYTSTD